jgi:predicted nucleic acid-binding protein
MLPMTARNDGKQNVTISLSRLVLKKPRKLAAGRETSIIGLLAQEIEFPVGKEESMLKSRLHFTSRMNRIGFRDALFVVSALRSGANRILSEDLNAGQTIAGKGSKSVPDTLLI